MNVLQRYVPINNSPKNTPQVNNNSNVYDHMKIFLRFSGTLDDTQSTGGSRISQRGHRSQGWGVNHYLDNFLRKRHVN